MDFFAQYRQDRLQQQEQEQEDAYERNFIERLFAPIQAPQEALFSFTTEVAKDGFQFTDIWNALSHGARYFNPWSNEKPIDVNDVREVFFGEEAEGVLKFAQNTAISLLYDPLLFTGLLKGVGAAGRAASTLDKVLNPAELAIDGMRLASEKVLGPIGRTAAYKVLGKDRADRWGSTLMQWLVDRNHGVSEGLLQAAKDRDLQINRWRERAYHVIKQSEELGGHEAQRLLTEALELDAAFIMRSGGELTKDMNRQLDALTRKIDAAGIDRDLFWENYDRFRAIDDEIGKALVESGALNSRQFQAMRGTHLRRIYQAFENPLAYAKRVEDLNIPDVVATHKKALYDRLNAFRSDLNNAIRGQVDDAQPSMFDLREVLGVADTQASRYFESNGRFHVKNFVDDLDEWLTLNSSKTVDEVFEHINGTMLAGVNLPAGFNKTIGDYLDGTIFIKRGSQHYADMIRGWANQPRYSFRVFAERLEVIADRTGIPQEIREAMGEILEASPRLASEAVEAGTLAGNRAFQSRVAGARRITEEQFALLQQADEVGLNTEQGRRLVQQVVDSLNENALDSVHLTVDDLARELPDVFDGGVGTRVGRRGSEWASEEPNELLGHTVKLPDHEGYGDLAGMYVSPTNAHLIRRMEGTFSATTPEEEFIRKSLNILERWTGRFKRFKAVYDPVAQVRNFIGNAALMYMAGVSPLRVDLLHKAGKELRHYISTGELSDMMKLAEEAGVNMFANTWTKAELGEFASRIAANPERAKDWKNIFEWGFDVIKQGDKKLTRTSARWFDFSERLFKLTVFTDRYENLASNWTRAGKALTDEKKLDFAKQAGALAERALFNYADVPYLIDFVRKYGIIPFATFPFKATSFVAETMYRDPYRLLRFPRIVDQANEAIAGSSADVAAEIEALPEHVRQNLVVRLPWKDDQGRPQYLDLSYFMPWSVIQDALESLEPTEAGRDVPTGFRSGMMTPPLFTLYDAARFGIDSQGNRIWDPQRSNSQNFRAFGAFMAQFILPPSLPGGSRADSIGRAMQAMARSTPEPVRWLEVLGRIGRGFGANPAQEEEVLNAIGFRPQSQSQFGVGVGGLEPTNPLSVLANTASGALFGGTVASDRNQSVYFERNAYLGNRTQGFRDIAAIRSDRNLSVAEKNARIRRIIEQMNEAAQRSADRLNRL